MFVGHNFDSLRGYEASRERGGEVGGQFWSRLLRILQAADLRPEACFFTNAHIGLKPGKATGAMPSVPGYRTQCQAFLDRQVEIVKPSAVVALGTQAIKYVSRLRGTYIMLRHPGDWVFRELSQRDALLAAEGKNYRNRSVEQGQ
jgi:uracil-DNA glycosylase